MPSVWHDASVKDDVKFLASPLRSATESIPTIGTRIALGGKSSWSADGNEIVYQGPNESLQILNPSNGNARDLCAGNDPAWCPKNGGPIAFATNGHPDQSEVWLIDADGSNARLVDKGLFPNWSSDGSRLYFYSPTKLAIMEHDAVSEGGVTREFFSQPWSYYYSVSPDESQVASFSGDTLFVIERVTRNQVAYWKLSGAAGGLCSWHPDGKLVGLGAFGENASVGMWIFDCETKAAKMVTSGPCRMPSWSHDGSMFTFDVSTNSGTEIRLVRNSDAVIRELFPNL
jgi:Tol biopolymer transport system component